MPISRRQKTVKIILHVFGVLFFVFATSYALLAAYGYQIDLLHRNIVKTSIIDLVGDYQNIEIYANGEQVADKIPYQIKNIKPDTYKVEIKSENFHDWKRTVNVVEDFVTIIDDIYLVPKELDIFTVFNELDFTYDDVVFNGQLIVFVDKEKNLIHKLNLTDGKEGEFKTITLLNEIPYENLYSIGSRYLVFDDENIINLLDLSADEFVEILVPNEFNNFKLGYTSSLQGIYSNNGSLFSVDINEEGVFNEITLLAERLQTINVEMYSEGNYLFVKLDDDLYEYRDHLLTLIASDVASEPYLSPNGNEVLYLSNKGEIHTYSFEKFEDYLLGRFADEINYIGWFFDGKHIFILKGDDLLLCDLTMENCPAILNNFSSENIFISKIKPLMVIISQEGVYRIDLTFE